MGLKNKSMYAILGILNLSPSTGYDIKAYSDKVLSGFWNENFGHIYPTLKTLLAEGMIEVAEGGKSDKKIKYAITGKGKMELEAWLAEDTARQPVRSEFLLKLLFSSDQPTEQVTGMLDRYKERHERSREKYLAMQNDLAKGIDEISPERARYIGAVLKNGVASCEAVIRWCDDIINDIRG